MFHLELKLTNYAHNSLILVICIRSKFHAKFSKVFSIYCQNNLVTLVMISFRIDECLSEE